MRYSIQRSSRFLADVGEFGDYCNNYSSDFALSQMAGLDYAIQVYIGDSPSRWRHFVHTGPPYRAYLFRVGEHTQYWIVYTVDEASKSIRLLRLWGTSRNEANFSVI